MRFRIRFRKFQMVRLKPFDIQSFRLHRRIEVCRAVLSVALALFQNFLEIRPLFFCKIGAVVMAQEFIEQAINLIPKFDIRFFRVRGEQEFEKTKRHVIVVAEVFGVFVSFFKIRQALVFKAVLFQHFVNYFFVFKHGFSPFYDIMLPSRMHRLRYIKKTEITFGLFVCLFGFFDNLCRL